MLSRVAAVSSSQLAFGVASVLVFVASGACSDNSSPIPFPGSGDGSTDVVDGAAAAPSCPDAGVVVDPSTLIDDFEHSGNANLPMIAGRAGGWFASGDATPGAIVNPSGLAMPEPIPGGRCGSRHALHVTGSGFNDWGSLVAVAMHYGTNSAGVFEELPYDARARGYQGITFFARIGDTAVNTVRFAASDQYSRPEAGLCSTSGGVGNGCYDTFGVPLDHDLGTEWKEFRVPWTGMSQRSFGLQGGLTPDASKLYDISFNFPGRVVFDLWVDDVRFF